jgi:hypothetical protein
VLRKNRSTLALTAALAAVLLWMGPHLAAQSRQEKARQLLDKALEALGGQAFLDIKTVKQTGRAYSFYRQNLRGFAVVTIYNQYEPMRENEDRDWLPLSRREVYTEKGDYYVLFQNGKGWEITYLGARPLPEDMLQRYRISARREIFYILRYRLQEPGMYFYYSGTEIVDNVPTHAIEIIDNEGDAVTVYLRMSDNLPVQQVYIRRDPKTRIPYEEKSTFSKYRKVGAVTLPWNIQHQRDGEKTFELFGRTAEVNGKVNPAMFQLQSGIKVLPPMP